MDGLEARLIKLEKRVRVCVVLTSATSVILVSLLGWVGYNVWKYSSLQQRTPRLYVAPTSAPLVTESGPLGTSLFTASNDTRPFVSLVAKDQGWALQLHDENGVVGDKDEMSVVFRVSDNGTPTLSLIGKKGKEVWRAP